MKIPLHGGGFALVSAEDYEELSKYKWRLSSNGYVIRTEHYYSEGKRKTLHPAMHRQIMGEPAGRVVDHINRDKQDNRRENLRICTQSENNLNNPLRSTNTSGHHGVRFKKDKKRWIAEIGVGGKTLFIGNFNDIESAVKARKAAERQYYPTICA